MKPLFFCCLMLLTEKQKPPVAVRPGALEWLRNDLGLPSVLGGLSVGSHILIGLFLQSDREATALLLADKRGIVLPKRRTTRGGRQRPHGAGERIGNEPAPAIQCVGQVSTIESSFQGYLDRQ